EIVAVVVPHLREAERPVASFGQGCEGEPLTEYELLATATAEIKQATGRGTVNLNTNGFSAEHMIHVIDAGLESARISLNSADAHHYEAYYRPVNYHFDDVTATIAACSGRGIMTSLNLLIHPGFNDNPRQIERLVELYDKAPFHMIQMRNLNIDPDAYEEGIGYQGSGIGFKAMMERLLEAVPGLRFGYYNPPKEAFQTWEIMTS
ncbi:radical SAM protein, partial [bacterium]|nr:radical SAM protein [candidate division CSSED10-310 bacterium]